MATLLLATSLCTTVIVSIFLMRNQYSTLLVFGWILSIVLLIQSAFLHTPIHIPRIRWNKRSLIIVCIILLPIVVRLLNYQPTRIHGDDLLTAYFSTHYHPRTTNFFSGIPDGTEWVAKFPTPYFFFQKIFLNIFGATVHTVKLSILPYVFIVSIMTYVIASMLFGSVTGIVAVIIYAFMAISIYHETLGLHFVSSTALYMLFLYTLIQSIRKNTPCWFVFSGIMAASCYLSYTSSYIALPMLILAILVYSINHKKNTVTQWVVWSLMGFLVTFAPFLTYAITQENYFSGRIQQVSLLTGSWSTSKLTHPSFTLAQDILTLNAITALRAMMYDGIGGHGGYTFNQKAFFHPLGLFLFLLGSIILFLHKKYMQEKILIFTTVIMSFITGVVLTIPPPAYHRLTLTFPFIAIISAAPFVHLLKVPYRSLGIWTTCITLAIFAGTNLSYVQSAVKKEVMIDDVAIIQYINATYPNRHIHIAAFPSFALGKIYSFFTPKTARSIDTKYHIQYLKDFNTNEPYLYILTLPDAFKAQFMAKDPNGILIPFSEKYWIMVNKAQ